MNAMNMSKKEWLSIFLIGFSICSAVTLGWLRTVDKIQINVVEDGLLQLAIMGLAGLGTFFIGQLDRERHFRLHAKERYRRLRTLAELLGDIVFNLQQVKSKPRLVEDQNIEDELTDFRQVSHAIESTATDGIRYIKDCLRFWNDFAPDEVGKLHRDTLGEEDGE